MKIPSECDILVVGAGPAGSSAAAASAREGAATVLIDSKSRIGEQPHCGEFVPRQVFTELGLSKVSVVQPVERMETLVVDPNALSFRDAHDWSVRLSSESDGCVVARESSASGGYVVDRVRFDRGLAREAAEAGALVISSVRLVGGTPGNWILRTSSGLTPIRAKYTIAADGAPSKVASLMKAKRPGMLVGVQVEAPLTTSLTSTMVFLCQRIVGGYGWLFPKGRAANVGLGVAPSSQVRPNELLLGLVEWLEASGFIRPGRLARSGGMIPVSGIRDWLVSDGVLLCGDAAGLTHPITGAGIPQALRSGRIAGKLAAQAVETGDQEALGEYEREIRSIYSGVLGHAQTKRAVMMSSWNETGFLDTCKRTWIGFSGYRKRERPVQPHEV